MQQLVAAPTQANRRKIMIAISRKINLHQRARGFYLLEILIAVVVLSIGLLGIGNLQLKSKRANFESSQRSVAALLAQDMLVRMRANPSALDIYTSGGNGRTLTGSSILTGSCTANCTHNQLANFDLFQAEQSMSDVNSGLSSPTFCITGPDGGPGTYTVTLSWKGLTKLSNPAVGATCTQNNIYDDTTGDNAYRQVLEIQAFIDDA